MEYCSLEDAWGVKTFANDCPPLLQPQQWQERSVLGKQWPVSGPFGYRQPNQTQSTALNPITSYYMQNGVDGLLLSLPQQAIDELRTRLVSNNLNVVAGALLLGFVMLILWDVIMRRR